ncbi:PEP-CTERM sorting domain-containing protein [Pseudoduganella lutea]|uniref:PEP-CTERM sorting domain-containing protein n=1 Tax=Pseudoduganella lutea TaxID=321985 RepID=A0A4P6L4P4_9BURK|nr:PEP-CTERM sorting domain-containing protein [Pseudoduganella lutea]QBE66569.1 PEP-CTERM sorting domain-containing protein [Pseudoduganella lutea]
MKRFLLTAALVAACAPGVGAPLVLTGADVTAAVYCCTSPDELSRISTIGMAVVGDDVEFPVGTLLPLSAFYDPIPVDVDIGATTIELRYSTNEIAGNAAFNGHILRFTGAPAIVGVSINPLSNYAPVGVTFLHDAVMINSASVQFNPDSRLVLDVALAVPEPAGAILLVAGLAVIGSYARRQKSEKFT